MNVASFGRVTTVYNGSDGEATRALYADLERVGPQGVIALNLFRAQKNSARAKVYRGGGYRGKAYDRKQWAMDNLVAALGEHAKALSISWGWKEDPLQAKHNQVLYVDLPTGQISFHTELRGPGPDYESDWDGLTMQSPGRICRWCATLLED